MSDMEENTPTTAPRNAEKRPSDYFLALVQEKRRSLPLSTFRELMNIWMEILDMEAIVDAMMAPSPTPELDKAEKKPEPAPMDDEARKEKRKQQSERGKTAFSMRKNAALGAVSKARANGVTLQTLADASNLTLNEVLDLIDVKAKPITDWAKLEKGLRKLGFPPGGEAKPAEEDGDQDD